MLESLWIDSYWHHGLESERYGVLTQRTSISRSTLDIRTEVSMLPRRISLQRLLLPIDCVAPASLSRTLRRRQFEVRYGARTWESYVLGGLRYMLQRLGASKRRDKRAGLQLAVAVVSCNYLV
jgi:hypothetical protein